MFVIIYQNSVILGPMRWNRFRFENEIQEECEFSVTLPDVNNAPIVVSDEIIILPIQGTPTPEFNSKVEFLNGPFWEFTDSVAIMSYSVEPLEINAVKNMLKEQVTTERWNKENAGVQVTLNTISYNFPTDRETRTIFQNAILNLDTINWKLDRETWIPLTKPDIQTILNTLLNYVQSCFDWEFTKFNEIDACTTLAELDAIVIVENAENV